MSAIDPNVPATRRPTVFLSYASEDRAAAQRLRDSLPTFGLEVWYDESALVGGDAWDQKIRRQIRECDFFMPVISSHTESRHEGYFRREWRLAVERTLDMADDHVFLLPVVIDETPEAHARVPEKFRAVQWLRLPGGEPTAALEAFCRRVISSGPVEAPAHGTPQGPWVTARRVAPEAVPGRRAAGARGELPEFPREEPGQRIRFWFQVAGWLLRSAWASFRRLPGWVRYLAYAWLFVLILSRGCTPSHDHDRDLTAAQAQKLQQIAGDYRGSWTGADTAKLIAQVARQIPADAAAVAGAATPVVAIPFAAPAGDAAARQLAAGAFTQVYGRLVITHHGVALSAQPLPQLDPALARARGRAHGARYVVFGGIEGAGGKKSLEVQILRVADGAVVWSKSYPVAGADAARIAAQVSSELESRASD